MAIAIVGVGLLWRAVRYALGFPIWGDEAFVAVDLVGRDFADMIRPLTYGQIVPLVFMWAELAVARLLGYSEWALRLVPFLAGVASVLLFWRLATQVSARRPAMIAVAIFAVSYYCVRHAAELKPYSTDLLVSLILLMLGWQVHTNADAGRRWLLLTLAAAAAPWCSYPSIFVAGAIAITLGWTLHPGARIVTAKRTVWWTLFCLVLCGSFLSMYALYGKPHADFASRLKEIEMWTRTFPPVREPWKLPVWFALIHTGNMFAYPAGGPNGGSTATFLLFVVGLLATARRNPALTAMLIGPIALTFAAAALQLYPYGGSARTSLYMAPAICLLAGAGAWQTLRRIVRRSAARFPGRIENVGSKLVVIAMVGVAAVGLVRDFREPSKDPSVARSHRAVREVAARVGAADRWIMFNAIRDVPWAPNLADWRGTGAQWVFDSLRFSPVAVEWSPDPATIAAGPGRVWLLAYRGVREPFSQEALDAYVATLAARLGTPVHEWHLIKEKTDAARGTRIEGFDVYRFDP